MQHDRENETDPGLKGVRKARMCLPHTHKYTLPFYFPSSLFSSELILPFIAEPKLNYNLQKVRQTGAASRVFKADQAGQNQNRKNKT